MNAGKRQIFINWLNTQSWILAILFFIAGCTITYIGTQYRFFDLDYDINVVENLVSVATLVVGLYLGITINSKFSNKQHFIQFIQPKLEDVGKKANELRTLLDSNNSIDGGSLSKQIKVLDIGVLQLKNVFKIFEKQETCIGDIDLSVDALDKLICGCPVQHNVYDYSSKKQDVEDMLNAIDSKIIQAVNVVHRK